MHPINQFYDSVGEFIEDAMDAHLEEYGVTVDSSSYYVEDYMNNSDPLGQAERYKCPQFSNVHWVDGYTRSDGTYVKGHWRSNPDGITSNNLNP
ncbi:hypothetical protein OCI51_25895 (plasmid) [Lysinibacillus capsici]|jgi:hypothetical protein|uniref:hypothetical protein n=1 Tax=Lysinibacillus TaxID=400634 RepID=UPI0021DA2C47|nr:hypothetical protein [Lysinibacillus capsici]UYB50093.1 hypothetical protein OCI51_25895 [Lysinibacillus capsici]